MRIKNKHRIKCDREQVWDKLMDINFLGKVIPGGKKFSQSGRNKYKGTLWVKVGFFKGKLKATLTLEKKDKPSAFRLHIFAKGAGTSLRGHLDFKLKQKGECETELSYEGDLNCKHLPGFVKGEIQKKLKKAIYGLCKSIEKECKHKEKQSRIKDSEESVRERSRVEPRFEEELAELINKAQKQFEVELAGLITKAGTQLTADLTELISRIENHSQEDDDHAH